MTRVVDIYIEEKKHILANTTTTRYVQYHFRSEIARDENLRFINIVNAD